jgi:hypothetical protein
MGVEGGTSDDDERPTFVEDLMAPVKGFSAQRVAAWKLAPGQHGQGIEPGRLGRKVEGLDEKG